MNQQKKITPRRINTLLINAALIIIGMQITHSVSAACPACGPVLEPTWSERLAQSEAALLVQWVSAQSAHQEKNIPAQTIVKITQIANDTHKQFKKNQQLTLPTYTEGKPGNLFFLWGKQTVLLKTDRENKDSKKKDETKSSTKKSFDWQPLTPMSETAYHYLTQAPSPEIATHKRLRYFLQFFEFPDNFIATDAYVEFAKAPYKDVKAVAANMNRNDVRKWLADSQTAEYRIGLYGLMMGLCGDKKKDVPFLEQQIVQLKKQFRIGVDGVIAGYLMLVGETGLDLIDRTKFRNKNCSEAETYSALQAIRIIWTYGNGCVSKQRLRQSVRLLLDRPEMIEQAIPDLARWKDWSVQHRLAKIYGTKNHEKFGIKRSIIQYLHTAAEDAPKDKTAPVPPHVTTAKKLLSDIKKKDPKTYKKTMRFLL